MLANMRNPRLRFLAGLLLALLAAAARGQVPAFVASNLTSPGSISARSAPVGATLAAAFSYVRGSTPALVVFRYNGPVAVTYSGYADSTFSFQVADSDPLGN
jgi:predicted aconitase